jgi:hypothetical protein
MSNPSPYPNQPEPGPKRVDWLQALSASSRAAVGFLQSGGRAITGGVTSIKGNLSAVIALSLGLFSYVTTGVGMASLVEGQGLLAMAIAGGLGSLIVSIGVFVFWTAHFQKALTGLGARLFCLFLAIAFTFVSITFASATTSLALNTASFDAEVQADGVSAMSEPLVTLRGKTAARAAELKNFAATASRLSTIESSSGGTCSVPSGSSCGKICRMRARLAQEAEQHSTAVAAVAMAAIDAVSLTSGGVLDEKQWRDSFRTGSAIANSPALTEASQWAKSTKSDFENGFLDAESGSTFECEDPRSVEALNRLIAAFDQDDIGYPDTPPTFVRSSFSYAVATNLGVLQDIALAPFSSTDDFNAEAAERMALAWLGALLVELGVIGGLMLHVRLVRRRKPYDPDADDGNEFIPEKTWETIEEIGVPAGQRKRLETLVSTALDHSLTDVTGPDASGEWSSTRYLFETDCAETPTAALLDVIGTLGLKKDPTWPGPIEIASLPERTFSKISARFPSATTVIFYPFTKGQEDLLTRYIRAVGAAGAAEPA